MRSLCASGISGRWVSVLQHQLIEHYHHGLQIFRQALGAFGAAAFRTLSALSALQRAAVKAVISLKLVLGGRQPLLRIA